MSKDKKERIEFAIHILQKTMIDTGCVLGIFVDEKDYDNSKIAFFDYKTLLNKNKTDGIQFSIIDINRPIFIQEEGGQDSGNEEI